MRFVIALLLMLLATPVYGNANTPDDVMAVQALIEKFDTPGIVVTEDGRTVPAFVVYAEAVAAYGDCAVDPLIVALEEEGQVRVAAAIALDMIGPASIKAKPQLVVLLNSSVDRDNILACGVIRGIGSSAAELVPLVREQLYHKNFHVQYWACRALASIGPGAHAATEDLCERLGTGVASVRRNAAIALGSIAPGMTLRQLQETVNVLEVTKLRDECHPVRIEAVAALAKIAEFQAQVD